MSFRQFFPFKQTYCVYQKISNPNIFFNFSYVFMHVLSGRIGTKVRRLSKDVAVAAAPPGATKAASKTDKGIRKTVLDRTFCVAWLHNFNSP